MEGRGHDFSDDVLLVDEEWILINPGVWVKLNLIWLFPNITNDIIPFLKSESVWGKFVMLAPSLKYLNVLKTFTEALIKHVSKSIFIWYHL